MVQTTFEKIFKGKKYDINKSIVEAALKELDYYIRESTFEIEALKYDGLGRFHFIIEVSSDGNIHRSSQILFHKDLGVGRGHKMDRGSGKVNKEFARFQKKLIVELKKYKKSKNQAQK